MKRIIIFSILFICVNTIVLGQGFIVEVNRDIDIKYQLYSPPLRINQVESQKEINYSKIEGLLQSYLSADNLEWALSDYFVKPKSISRNQEHFDTVKKYENEDYIQLESAYLFRHNEREFAYVKYSMIFEKLPFPWVSLLVLEKINNRWYLSKLINQNQILLLLGNTTPQFLLQCFDKESKDKNISKIISESTVNNIISMRRLSLSINDFDSKLKEKFYDNRSFNDTLKNSEMH
ncbi:hypothetical protein VOI54_14370 [Tamlana sp. 2201CG12-4]|uniref:hypothetical protein n=1 Tax=Tamlana sp. 2201CG12-4 TaxID=3112582 RepID=UPI002DBD0536|nr:hypothetical protein [Tamlana sp. 2201CG12-4]MEC3908212.1 hypothetical protein [Tamlana sp. 2201CG12-4]